jgi:hypothetical protein
MFLHDLLKVAWLYWNIKLLSGVSNIHGKEKFAVESESME